MHLYTWYLILDPPVSTQALYHAEVCTSRTVVPGFAGVSDQNIAVPCFDESSQTLSGSIFWIINGSVYGSLHVPREFVVCTEVCDLRTLVVPVVQQDMDGYTFQCVSIDYRGNMLHLGSVKELQALPQGFNGTSWYS